jgi:hypothetical protein
MGWQTHPKFQHATCRDKAAAEQAQRGKEYEERNRAEWKARHGDEPYPTIEFHIVKMDDFPFEVKQEGLLAYPFPKTKVYP